jgi:chromosome segregation ATPase
MQQQSSDPIASLLYRMEAMEKEIASIEKDISSMEKDFGSLKSQLNLYEPVRESDLKLQSIKDTTLRIETELSKVKEKIEGMSTRMVAQDQELQRRDAEQQARQDKLIIRVLWFAVSTVIAVLSAVLIGYLTHLIH